MLRTKLLTLSAVTAAAALSLTACSPSAQQGGGEGVVACRRIVAKHERLNERVAVRELIKVIVLPCHNSACPPSSCFRSLDSARC